MRECVQCATTAVIPSERSESRDLHLLALDATTGVLKSGSADLRRMTRERPDRARAGGADLPRQRRQDHLDLLAPAAAARYDDVWMLSNGNVLFTRMRVRRRGHAAKASSLALRRAQGHGDPLPASRSASTRSCSSQNGLPPKLIIMNNQDRDGRGRARRCPTPSSPIPRRFTAQFRRVRFTAAGHVPGCRT